MSYDGPLVRVQVMVNVEGLRRGWTGEVELSGRIEMLITRGYLKVLGHVDVISEAPPPPQPLPPPETPAASARPSRAKRRPTTTPAEDTDGDRPGDTDLE